MRVILCLLIICMCVNNANAQYNKDLITEVNFPKLTKKELRSNSLTERLVPLAMIAGGILLSKTDFEKSLQKDLRNSVGDDFYVKMDDYTRYAPIVQMYSADLFGVESRNHWFDQTKNLALSAIIANTASTVLKKEVGKGRPGDPNEKNSFPSGHTTTAFATASVLYEEFIDTNPLLAYSGYIFAATTGGLRMLNNKHYLSDVLVGAGIGILSTKLVYALEDYLSWNPFKKTEGLALAPQFGEDHFGFYLSQTF